MKKVFLLAAVAIATSANAQVIQFNTDAAPLELTSDGKPLTAGTAIGSNDALSVAVAFDDTYKLTDCKGNAFNSIKFDDVEALTKGGITGSNNAVDVDGKAPRITHKVPAQGTAYAIESSKDGYMYIVNKFSPNKTYTIFEDGKLIGHKLAMETVANADFPEGIIFWELKGEGEYNYVSDATVMNDWFIKDVLGWEEGQDAPVNPGNGLGAIWVPVYNGGKYLFCANGSKASVSAVYFAEAEASTITVADADSNTKVIYSADPSGIANVAAKAKAENARMFNLAGQEVGKNFKGIVVVNGKKFMNK